MTRWPIARYLMISHFIFLIFVLFCFYAVSAVILGVAAALTDITLSTVDIGGQVLNWLTLGYGTSATGVLATVLVHGRTRREFMVQHPVFQIVTALTAAAVITGMYAAETALYSAFGWQQQLQPDRVFTSATDYPTIFTAYACLLLTWMLVGAFLGAAFYRWRALGVVAVLPGAALLSLSGGVTGFTSLPFTRFDLDGMLPMIGVTALLVVITWSLLWAVVRDIPLRIRTA